MNHDQVIQLLKDYRSYRYAVTNLDKSENNFDFHDRQLPYIYSERKLKPNQWDYARYRRIVDMIDGAVTDVLSDDQRTVINRKYLDRNTMTLNEIAKVIHRERSAVSRMHTEAIRRLSIALEPLSEDEIEITNFDHMFERKHSA